MPLVVEAPPEPLHCPLAPPVFMSAVESGWGALTLPDVPAVPDVACEPAVDDDELDAYAAAGP